jgi:hypothetical protein
MTKPRPNSPSPADLAFACSWALLLGAWTDPDPVDSSSARVNLKLPSARAFTESANACLASAGAVDVVVPVSFEVLSESPLSLAHPVVARARLAIMPSPAIAHRRRFIEKILPYG